jgi:protein-disulfide isomerase
MLLAGLLLMSCGAGPEGLSEPVEAASDANAWAETPEDSDRGEILPAVIDSDSVTDGYQEGFTADGEPYKGNPEAAVVIEEFSSYQCPFCARFFQQTYPKLAFDS